MRKLILNFIRLWGKLFYKLHRFCFLFEEKYIKEEEIRNKIESSTKYDMVIAPDEPYYAAQYQAIISPYLTEFSAGSNCLDLGCSQGRFAIFLATKFKRGKITACDISEKAIHSAKQYSQEKMIENINFLTQDIEKTLEEFRSTTFDIIMMTEVTFFYPKWENQISRITSLLKPKGLLIMSFRSQYYNALSLVKNRIWDNIPLLLETRRGKIFNSPVEFSWQKSEDIRATMKANELDLIELRGIGLCSGIPGDPHASIVRPSLLTKEEQNNLMKLELELGTYVPDAGRYMLAIARKK